jgi:hypothetical protein
MFSPDEQSRSLSGQPAEQQSGEQAAGLRRALRRRNRNRGVIVEDGNPAFVPESPASELLPVRIGETGEGDAVVPPHILGCIVPAPDRNGLAGIGEDTSDSLLADLRPDVVEDGRGDRSRADRGDRHRDQPAHRRPDEYRRRDAETIHQAEEVPGIDFRLVVRRIRIPFRSPTSANVGHDDPPPGFGNPRGQLLEIRGIAGEAMEADDRQTGFTCRRPIVTCIQPKPV